jgi:hypothetical protein
VWSCPLTSVRLSWPSRLSASMTSTSNRTAQ